MLKRYIHEQVVNHFFLGKAIIIYGPRQVGKTTMIQEIIKKYEKSWYLNADDPAVRKKFDSPSLTQLTDMLQWYELVVIDEAQRIENIWLLVKMVVDTMPQIQIVVTWSSSFELANTISEPLTWRKYVFHLYPFSREELVPHYDIIQRQSMIETRMLYGMYPEIVLWSDPQHLSLLVDSYLYKDLLEHQRLRKADVLMRLLQAIALQLWSEVSYSELAQTVWVDVGTIEKYIDLLEKSFVIYRLWSLSRNLRNELKKSKKIYFRDLGVRNTIINAMNPLSLRNDVGALWENFCLTERIKYLSNNQVSKNKYFRRTKSQQEIDYVEEANFHFDTYEFKRSSRNSSRPPQSFFDAYPDSSYTVITPENFEAFVVWDRK